MELGMSSKKHRRSLALCDQARDFAEVLKREE